MSKKPEKTKRATLDFDIDINGLGFMEKLEEIIPVKARYNTGLCLDLLCGRPQVGRYGDVVMNGGIAPYTGVCGAPNVGKSTWMDTMGTILNQRYGIPYLKHNNEADANSERFVDISYYVAPELQEWRYRMHEHRTLRELDLTAYTSADMWETIRQLAARREAQRDQLWKETPFLDEDGEPVRILMPFAHSQDSLSEWKSNVIEKKLDENDVGAKENATFGLMHGAAKTQMVSEIPTMCARGGMIIFQSAHMGDKFKLDAYAPVRKKMEYLAGDLEIKFVSNNWRYLPNNLWWVMGNSPLLKKASDGKYYPEFQMPGFSKIAKDTDLTLCSIVNLRGKNGPSGVPFDLVMSQSRGLIPFMTNFRYIWESETSSGMGFGISGSDKAAWLDIYPEVKFNRFNIFELAEKDVRLQRAIRFTADLCILHERIRNYPRHQLCSAQELYTDIKKLYDWNEFLDTRDYWTWDHYTHPLKYLSIYDLLNFRLGVSTPYWKQ